MIKSYVALILMMFFAGVACIHAADKTKAQRIPVDGQETWRTNEAISQRSLFLIMSLEVGSWAGDIKKAKLPDHLYVDYIRVYQKAKSS
ncbi:hypothetical protein ACFL3F_00990 [Planctomycetota bacterium]